MPIGAHLKLAREALKGLMVFLYASIQRLRALVLFRSDIDGNNESPMFVERWKFNADDPPLFYDTQQHLGANSLCSYKDEHSPTA